MARPAKERVRLEQRCRMREIRGDRRLRGLQSVTGVSVGSLSQIERGERLPLVEQLPGLERGYGPREHWYTVAVIE